MKSIGNVAAANPLRHYFSNPIVSICAASFILLSLIISISRNEVVAVAEHSSTLLNTPANRPSTKGVNWKLEKTSGDKPSARGGGKLVAVGNQLVVLYGFFECFELTKCEHVYFDEIYALDLATNRWKKKTPRSSSGALPAKRVFFGAATYKKKNTAVIYGGSEYSVKGLGGIKMYDDMWEYNPQTDTMVERKFKNEGPGRRLGPEIVISGDVLYLFGGYDLGFKAHNDLWSYDLTTDTWKQLKKDDDPQSPSKRYIFRFEVGPSNKDLFLFGGNYRETKTIQRNDLWKYNIPTNTFTEIISEKSTNITGRTHGAAAVYGDHFVIALGDIPSGGCLTEQASEQQNPTKEVWSISVRSSKSVVQWQPVRIGFSPPPLKRVIYTTLGDRLYVTQGFDYKCNDPKTTGPIYNLETYSLQLSQIR